MTRLASAAAAVFLGTLMAIGALPAAAGTPSQISGFKVSVTDTHGMEVDYNLTAYATKLGKPYVKAGYPLDYSSFSVYTTFH